MTPLRRAFTLVELLVVIGVIVLLVGLTVAVFPVVIAKAQTGEAETTLRLLDLAVQEWELTADRRVSWGVDGAPTAGATYDLTPAIPDVYGVTELLSVLERNDGARDLIRQIPADRLVRYDTTGPAPSWLPNVVDPFDPDPKAGDARSVFDNDDLAGAPLNGRLTVLDPWDMPIRVVHPGRLHQAGTDPANNRDADGTVFVDLANFADDGHEEIYGRALNRRVAFVSAGPDGHFGSVAPGASDAMRDAAADNIESYGLGSP